MTLFSVFIVILVVVIILIVYGALIVSSQQERMEQRSRKRDRVGEISRELEGEDELNEH